jgi:hypothetical protein
MDENTPIIVKTDDLFVNNPKLEQVFSSIEKQLVAQTGFLKSMQGDISDQFKFNKDMVRKTESEKRRESVAGEDGSNALESSTSDPKNSDDKKKNLAGDFGIGGILATALGGIGLAGLLGVALKKTLPALLAPVIGSFVNGAVTQALTDAGASENTAKLIGDTADTAVTWGIWGKMLFGKWGGLAGLLAGVGSHLGGWMDLNQDGVIGGAMGEISSDPKFWDNFGMTIGAGLGLSPILYKVAKALGLVGKKSAEKIADAALKAATETAEKATAATPPAAAGKPLTQLGTVGEAAAARRAAAEVIPIPSGSNVGVTGKVVAFAKGKFKSIADIVEAMKSDPTKAAKLAKYAKFFKFAGPAMSVIPALIDPAMAIYNDESDEEIKKQIVGALGSVSGAYLGAIAGAGLTTLIPVVGQSGIGNLLGGIIGGVGGAMSGEYLTEELADALLGGPDPEPVDAVVEAIPTLNKSSETYSESVILKPSTTPSTAPAIEPVIPMQGKVAEIDRQQISIAGGGAGGGVNVNQMGGNVSNNTNVGGSSTTFNVFQGGGSSALSNSLPVNMTTA